MRVFRIQFTVRSLMFAVAMAAIVLTIEIGLFNSCKKMASPLGYGVVYYTRDAFTIWAMFQVPILLTLCLACGIYRNYFPK
jgi:hypothetical protein